MQAEGEADTHAGILDPVVIAAVRFSVDRAIAQRGLVAPRLAGMGMPALASYWAEAMEAVGEELSLMVASDMPLGALGLASVDTMSAPTLGDALDALGTTHLGRLVPDMRLLVTDSKRRVEIRLTSRGPAALMAQLEEIVLALVHRHLALLTRPVRALGVELRRSSPLEAVAPWRLFFGATPRFACTQSSLFLEAESLAVPLRTANAQVQAIVRSATAPATTSGKVRAYVRGHLHQPCELASVAVALEMSTRQLQRSLHAEKASLRDLVSTVRVEVAEQILAHSSQPIAEISAAVGFAHPGSFTRAFVATRGETPQAFRHRVAKR